MRYTLYLRNYRGTTRKGEYDDLRHALEAFEFWSRRQYVLVHESWRYFERTYHNTGQYDYYYDNVHGRVWVEDDNENIIAGMSISEYNDELDIKKYRDEIHRADRRFDHSCGSY